MQQDTDTTTTTPITKPAPRKPKAAAPKSTTQTPAAETTSFQARVLPWLLECFGEEIASNRRRNHRFLEEALELVRRAAQPLTKPMRMVDYVGRPVGEASQEVR